MEADRFGELIDLRLIAGQKVPALSGVLALIPINVGRLLFGRQFRLFTGIEAHRQNRVLLAYAEITQRAETAGQAVENLIAKLRAAIVNQRQDDRLAAEVIAELHGVARFITKRQIERQLLIEFLIDP